jgi:hypothetical protein
LTFFSSNSSGSSRDGLMQLPANCGFMYSDTDCTSSNGKDWKTAGVICCIPVLDCVFVHTFEAPSLFAVMQIEL